MIIVRRNNIKDWTTLANIWRFIQQHGPQQIVYMEDILTGTLPDIPLLAEVAVF